MSIPVFTGAALRLCYWHQIIQKFDKKVLAGSSSTRRAWLAAHVSPRLDNIFNRAENAQEQFAAWGELFKFLAPAQCKTILGKDLHARVGIVHA